MKTSTSNTPSNSRAMSDEQFNLREAVTGYLRYWPFFISSIVVATLLAFLINQYTPAQYQIESKFLIKEESNAMNLFDFSPVEGGLLPKGQKVANEMIMLKSRTMAEKVLDQLPFNVEYYNEGIFKDTELYKDHPISIDIDWNAEQLTEGMIKVSWVNDSLYHLEYLDKEYQKLIPGESKEQTIQNPSPENTIYPFGEWIDTPDSKFRIRNNGLQPTGTLLVKVRSRESLIRQYTGDNLTIAPSDKISSILTFTLETTQPEKGRDYLNTLMAVFLDEELDEKNSIAMNTVRFIDSQLSGISDSLAYAENRLERFRTSHRTYNITTEGSTIFEKLSDLEKSLSEENFKKEYYQNLQDYLAKEDYTEIVLPSGLGIDDPVLNKLIVDLIGLQSDKSRFLATQTENSPTVREVNRKINDLRSSIKDVLRNVRDNSNLLIADLEKRITKIENQFGRLPQTEQDLLNIRRTYSFNENIYNFLLQRRTESAIALASNKPTNKIIDLAVANYLPMRIRPMLNYFLALLIGLILPFVTITLRDFFNVKLTDLKEIEDSLTVPVVGHIGRNRKQTELVVLNEPNSGIAESFRALRTNLTFLFPKDKSITMMITSTIAGEGKTFCAMNLASVYAVGSKKTLLIGCDLHKSFKLDPFNITNDTGLSNYLSGQVDEPSDIVQNTANPLLDVLVPGPVPPNPSELLLSERFELLLTELRRIYDVIILDSSPLGLTNESLYLTKLVDASILVLRQGYSERSFLSDINGLKEKKGINNVYALVNDIKTKQMKYNGYGYGYYSEDQKNNGNQKAKKRLLNHAAM